jgi:fermentation-respiration switch protein FrsA (DUF1100 family)
MSRIPALAALALAVATASAHAAVTFSSAVGGAATAPNVTYHNLNGPDPAFTIQFDALNTDGGLFTGSDGNHAAPFFSNDNGDVFGEVPANGEDQSQYLSSGVTYSEVDFATPQRYVGFLWGSVDDYNTLRLFDGGTEIGLITGSDISSDPHGNRGPGNTYYVNVNSDEQITTALFSSSTNAFEIDDIALSVEKQEIPEPASVTTLVLGCLLLGGWLASREKHLRA